MTKYDYFPEKPDALVSIINGTVTEVIDAEDSYYLTTEISKYLLHIRVPKYRLQRMPFAGDSITAKDVQVYDHGSRVDGEPYAILSAVRPQSKVILEQP